MKLRLNTLLATAICLSAIAGLEEPILLTQGNPETDDLPDELAQAILESEHGHCLKVVEPKVDAGLADAQKKDTPDGDPDKDKLKTKTKAH